MPEKIALSDVLSLVRHELLQADEKAKAAGFGVMQFEECEVEFAVEVEKSGTAGFAIHFLTLGGSLKKSEQNTIRVKFKALASKPLIAEVGDYRQPGPPLERQTPRRKQGKKRGTR